MFENVLRKLGLLMFVLLFGLLTACGNSTTDSKPGAAAPETPSAQGATETITYKAANGEIKVPKDPKRVVELTDSYVGNLLALGIKPIGVTQHALENPYFKGKLDGVENLGDGKSVEKILELQPDLIIAPSYMDATVLEKLSKIAPTVALEYGKLPVREQHLEIGKLTGKEDKAKEWIANWDKKIAEAKPKVEAAVGDKTVSILQPYAKGIYAFGHNYGRGGEIIYGEFHLKAPQAIQKEAIDSGQGWANLSLEKLPDYAGDFIFTSAWSGDDADPSVVYDTNVWKSLPAVKNNRVFQLDKKGSFFNDPISLEAQLDFIVDSLTGNK